MKLKQFYRYVFVFLLSVSIFTGCGSNNDGGTFVVPETNGTVSLGNNSSDVNTTQENNNTSDVNTTQENNNTSDENTTVVTKTKGYLIDSPLQGVTYFCDGNEALTDANGLFECVAPPVTFKIGGLTLGTLTEFTADGKVYPQDLLGLARTNFTDSRLKLLARLLQSLDDDENISIKITITQSVRSRITTVQDFKDMSQSDVQSLLSGLGKSLVAECGALEHLGDTSVSCGSDGGYYVNSSSGGGSNINQKSPNIVTIIGLTSIDSDKITLEWLEASDDKTSKKNIKYEIHVSKDKNFTPDSSTLKKSLKGVDFTTIDGLDEDTEYFVKIVAIDEDNLKSTSFESSIKTSSIKVKISPKTKYLKTTKQVLSDSIVVENNSTLKNNDIIVSEKNGGFARKITKVIDKNGQKTLETRAVSLAEIYDDMNVHTLVKLVSLEQSQNQNQKLSNVAYKTSTNNVFKLSKKWGSGLTLFDTQSINKVQNKLNKTQNKVNNKPVKEDIISEEAFTISMPKYYAFDIDDIETERIKLYFTPKEEKEYIIGYDDFYYEVCSVASEIIVPNDNHYLYFGKTSKSRNNLFNIDFSNHFQKIRNLVSEKPYTVKFSVRTAKQGTCNDKKPVYGQTYTIKRDLYIGTGSLAISGTIKETISFSGYSGKNLNITSRLTGSYSPELIIDSFVKDGKLETGKVEVVAKVNLENEIKAVLEASNGFEYKKTFINKKFIKVIPAGYVPLIFNGSFEVALVIEGSATGKIDITNTLINDYEFHAGFQYDKDTKKWNYIGKSENKFEIKLKGEAGAEVMLKVSLQPKLTLKLYDSVGGGVALDPYVKAEASGRMVKSISKNIDLSTMTGIKREFVNDQFISVDKVNGSLGMDLKWYVIASIFDYRLASYPKDVDENKASTYAQVQIVKPKVIASLPKLSIKQGIYLNKIGKDSRLMIIEGEAKPIVNAFYSSFGLGTKYIINHRRWSFTELIKPRQELLNPIDENSSLLLVNEVESDYKIRMLEESTLGLPHAVETNFKTKDDNYNHLPDSWEKAYSIYELGNTANSEYKDSDNDGLVNIEEFKHGTYPNIKDSDADGCTDKEEVDSNHDPLNKNDRPTQCISDAVVKLSLPETVSIKEKTKESITITIEDTQSKIKEIECSSSVKDIIFSNTKEEIEVTAPSYSEIKEFQITCIAKDNQKELAKDSTTIIVTKEDTSPISLSLGSNITLEEGTAKVVPFVIIDKNNKIDKITCFTTPQISIFNSTNKKVSFTTPSYDSLVQHSFTIRCKAKDSQNNELAQTSKKVNVLKKEPTNQAPTVSLPSSLGANNKIVPTEHDDKGIVKHKWSVSWSGDKQSEASPTSATSNTLTLNVPTLDAGESLRATVTLTVYDAEGEHASDTKTYNYRVEKKEAIKFISDNFTDGEVIPRGSTKHLQWTVKNVSNVDLKDVKLNITQETNSLTVSNIDPSTIALWRKGESKTFSVDVTVPNDITEGTHKQIWNFTYDGGKALPYEGKTSSASIFFEFKTTNPNDLVGRLITDKKLVTPNETVTSLLEITSGNAPYSIEVDWGDGNNEDFDDVVKNTDEGMTKSLIHKYVSEGEYSITVKVKDNAGKKATFTDTIKVEISTTETSWTADVHDIDTDEKESNINIIVESKDGKNQYHTNWRPSLKTDSTEYFVKYRLPIPSKLLMLNKKMRVTVEGLSSDIEAYDREINFRTSDSKEYTASIRHKDFEETLDNGTVIKGGYFTIKDLASGVIEKEEASNLNSDRVKLDGTYTMGINSGTLKVESYNGIIDEYDNLFSKSISTSSNWLTELDVTFKGNGVARFILLEYDLNNDGEFSDDEKLILNTADKFVEWSLFGEGEIPATDEIIYNGIHYGTVVSPITGRVWLDRNLGASKACESLDDEECFGDYYQWGRRTDGHEKKNSNFVNEQLFSYAYNSSNFIGDNYLYDWLYGGIESYKIRAEYWKTIDGDYICPRGYRVPSALEIEKEIFGDSNSVSPSNCTTLSGSYCTTNSNNFLKIPYAGIRSFKNGIIENIDNIASLWTTSYPNDNPNGYALSLDKNTINNNKIYGWYSFYPFSTGVPVRCVRDENTSNEQQISNLVSGHINFSDYDSVPSDAWIRIVPSVNQTDSGGYKGVNCKINNNGDFGDECYINENESKLRNKFNKSGETFEVVVYKNHIEPEEHHWNNGEAVYKYVGNDVEYGSWQNIEVIHNNFNETNNNDEVKVNNFVSGHINFSDYDSVPSDAWIRIVPSVNQTDSGGYKGVNCKINNNGDFGDECYINENESKLRNKFNKSGETFQVVVYKNHIEPEEHHWDNGEDIYEYIGNDLDYGSWQNIEVES